LRPLDAAHAPGCQPHPGCLTRDRARAARRALLRCRAAARGLQPAARLSAAATRSWRVRTPRRARGRARTAQLEQRGPARLNGAAATRTRTHTHTGVTAHSGHVGVTGCAEAQAPPNGGEARAPHVSRHARVVSLATVTSRRRCEDRGGASCISIRCRPMHAAHRAALATNTLGLVPELCRMQQQRSTPQLICCGAGLLLSTPHAF
jgi:hypothetical protein